MGDSIANDVEGALAAGLIPIWLDRYEDPCYTAKRLRWMAL